jgi:hypothetical protein
MQQKGLIDPGYYNTESASERKTKMLSHRE